MQRKQLLTALLLVDSTKLIEKARKQAERACAARGISGDTVLTDKDILTLILERKYKADKAPGKADEVIKACAAKAKPAVAPKAPEPVKQEAPVEAPAEDVTPETHTRRASSK